MTPRQERRGTALRMAVAAAGLVALVARPDAVAFGQGARQGGPEIAASDDKERPAPDASPPPGELAREGLAKLLQALDKLIESVPQYEMPEINENGDIILRRKRPEAAPQPQPQPNKPNQPDKRGI